MPRVAQTFTARLNALMEEGRFSKAEFSKKLGLSRTQLDRYLNGSTSPSLETLEALAKKLGVPALSLLLEPGAAVEHTIEECYRRIGKRLLVLSDKEVEEMQKRIEAADAEAHGKKTVG